MKSFRSEIDKPTFPSNYITGGFAYVSAQSIAKKMEMLTAADYRNQIAAGYRDASWGKGYDADWLKEITRTPFSHVHNVNFTDGKSCNQLCNERQLLRFTRHI